MNNELISAYARTMATLASKGTSGTNRIESIRSFGACALANAVANQVSFQAPTQAPSEVLTVTATDDGCIYRVMSESRIIGSVQLFSTWAQVTDKTGATGNVTRSQGEAIVHMLIQAHGKPVSRPAQAPVIRFKFVNYLK